MHNTNSRIIAYSPICFMRAVPSRKSPASSPIRKVLANGKPAKASYTVKVGDVLEIQFGTRVLKIRVESINEFAGKADAPAMYREIAD